MLSVWIDGACEPINPNGTASYGLLVKKDNVIILRGFHVVGTGEGMSNNVAEYSALLAFLKWLKTQDNPKDQIIIQGDSQLVIKQMSGEWKVNGGLYYKVYLQCCEVMKGLNINPEFKWIPREQNAEADKLSKIALLKIGIQAKVR